MSVKTYVQEQVDRRINRLTRESRVAFAAACAERLAPAYRAFADERRGDDLTLVTDALSRVWSCLETGDCSLPDPGELERQIPGDNYEWTDGTEFVESAVSCVMYAALAFTEPDAACWAAASLYEAADSAGQLTVSSAGEPSSVRELAIQRTPAVQQIIEGIEADLAGLELEALAVPALRARARTAGEEWRASFLP
jgi:hypothetical protein